MTRKISIIIIALHLCFGSAYPQDYNPLSKLARGMANVGLGWIEIFRQMMAVRDQHQGPAADIAGVFWGPLKGISMFIGRTCVGGYEIATCVLPPYKPLIHPEYIFSEEAPEETEEE